MFIHFYPDIELGSSDDRDQHSDVSMVRWFEDSFYYFKGGIWEGEHTTTEKQIARIYTLGGEAVVYATSYEEWTHAQLAASAQLAISELTPKGYAVTIEWEYERY